MEFPEESGGLRFFRAKFRWTEIEAPCLISGGRLDKNA